MLVSPGRRCRVRCDLLLALVLIFLPMVGGPAELFGDQALSKTRLGQNLGAPSANWETDVR